jgi:amino acid transporter
VQQTLSLDDPNVDSSPVAATAELLWGEFGRILVSTIGVVIVTANIAGVLVAFSRLIFASARSGLLPRTLTRTDRRGTPVTAVLVTASVFALLAIAEQLGWVTQATLFRLAASAFFATFVVATIAFIAETTGAVRLFGFGALAISVAVLASFGWFALYPLAVGAVALATTQWTQST